MYFLNILFNNEYGSVNVTNIKIYHSNFDDGDYDDIGVGDIQPDIWD